MYKCDHTRIETEEMKFEEVSRVKYLGTIVTKDNLIEEEIKKKESQPVIEPSLWVIEPSL